MNGGDLTYAQLEGLWEQQGGSSSAAAVAAAIAEAESSGNPGALSSNPDGGTNVGLWQLDTPGGKGAGYSVAQLQNPGTNAAVAVSGSSDGTDWSAWQTYADGTYEQFLNGSAKPTTTGLDSSGGSLLSGFIWDEPWTWGSTFLNNAAGDVESAEEKTAESLLEDVAVYAAIGVAATAGLVLIVAGLLRATGAGRRASQAAETVAPVAAAAAA